MKTIVKGIYPSKDVINFANDIRYGSIEKFSNDELELLKKKEVHVLIQENETHLRMTLEAV